MFAAFILSKVKKWLITHHPIEAKEKISTDLDSVEYYNYLNKDFTKFENNQIL
jgi:hypothetical protein